MNVATVYIATEGGSFAGFTHLLVNRRLMLGVSLASVVIERTCGHVHEKRIDYMDCPVASRWTIVLTGSKSAAATLSPHPLEGVRSAVQQSSSGDGGSDV